MGCGAGSGEETFRLCQQYVDEIILVGTDDTCAAIKDVFEDTRFWNSGRLAIAAAKAHVEREQIQAQTLIAAACGANMNFDSALWQNGQSW